MPFVLTADQVDSRTHGDLVDTAVKQLSAFAMVLPFTRTVGDEFQGLLADPASVVDVMLVLMRGAAWHIGLGIGVVEEPLPQDPRRARGPAFLAARAAVEAAKKKPAHLSVLSEPATAEAWDAEVVSRMLAALYSQRSELGWQAADLMEQGHTQAAAANRLNITRQALGQRLQSAHWSLDRDARPVLARLLSRAESAAQSAAAQEQRT